MSCWYIKYYKKELLNLIFIGNVLFCFILFVLQAYLFPYYKVCVFV